MITLKFTNGRISLRRGRVTRQYTPRAASYVRLINLIHNGPFDFLNTTNRSTIYIWEGYKTLTYPQRQALDTYLLSKSTINSNDSPIYATPWYAGYVEGMRAMCYTLHVNPRLCN